SDPPPPAPPPPPVAVAATPTPIEGWLVAGAAASAYIASADATVTHEGRATVVFRPTAETGDRYATFMTGLDCIPYRGRRVRASVWVRTIGVTGRGDFWMRAQAPYSPADGAGIASTRQRLRPDADFMRHELVLDVPAECDKLQLGVGIGGPGMLWMDGVRVDLVDAATAVMASPPRAIAGGGGGVVAAEPVDGWTLGGSGKDEYSFGRDTAMPHEGHPSVAMAPRGLPSGRMGALVREWDATPWRGRRVRVSAWVRTEGVTTVGDFSATTGGPASPPMEEPTPGSASRRLAPDGDFAPYAVELVVPRDAYVVRLSVGVAGPGKIWVEGGRVEEAGWAAPPPPPQPAPAPAPPPAAPPAPAQRGVAM
ncbi:MAG TPA: hypothetical protein VE987_20850, partial [Polyangiaceae bacterium]|nr:hypothetical protein [Polyangiaceae bacterium]